MKAAHVVASVAVVFIACGVGYVSAVCDTVAIATCTTDWATAFGETTKDCTKLKAALSCFETEVTACGDQVTDALTTSVTTAKTEIDKLCSDAPRATVGIAVIALSLISVLITGASY